VELVLLAVVIVEAAAIGYLFLERRQLRRDRASRASGNDARLSGVRLDEISHVHRVAALGELSASLAHELKQPLTAILSNAQAARRYLAQPVPDHDEIRQALGDIIEDDNRAVDLIGRMRSLLKKDAFEPVSVDVNAVVSDVARLVGNAARMKQVTFDVALAPSLPPVRGDRIQLQQVMLNLAINAVEASAAASGRPAVVRIATSAGSNHHVEVAVSDTGSGIAAADLQKIFEPFFTTKTDGLGMGLSISRSIVEAHGGRIWAEASPEGATVRVSLPAGDPAV
jgi:signal transduction histidine kinase